MLQIYESMKKYSKDVNLRVGLLSVGFLVFLYTTNATMATTSNTPRTTTTTTITTVLGTDAAAGITEKSSVNVRTQPEYYQQTKLTRKMSQYAPQQMYKLSFSTRRPWYLVTVSSLSCQYSAFN